jgi:hypothetical protein
MAMTPSVLSSLGLVRDPTWGDRTAPTYYEIVSALAPAKPPVYCDHGTVRVMSDVWESCSGCCGCTNRYRNNYDGPGGMFNYKGLEAWTNERDAAWAVGVFFWRLANLPAHEKFMADLSGFAALAAVGSAISGPAKLGASIAAFAGMLGEFYASPVVGWTYKVTGKRGKAKEFFGAVGECVWVGEVESGPRRPAGWRGTWRMSTTTKVKLKTETFDAPIWVPASCVTLVPTAGGIEALSERNRGKARAELLPGYMGRTGKRGDMGCVVSGKYAGKTGRVFWYGDRGKGPRVGIEIPGESEPAWLPAKEVVGPAGAFDPSRIEDAAAAAEAAMFALDAAGFAAEAADWGKVAGSLMPAR